MREIFRPAACALSVACLALAMSAVSSSAVLAQAKQAPPKQSAPAQAAPPPAAEAPDVKQIALTEKQIEGVLAAQKDVDAITDKIPDNAKPDPKIDAQLDVVKKPCVIFNQDGFYDPLLSLFDRMLAERFFKPSNLQLFRVAKTVPEVFSEIEAGASAKAEPKWFDTKDGFKS